MATLKLKKSARKDKGNPSNQPFIKPKATLKADRKRPTFDG